MKVFRIMGGVLASLIFLMSVSLSYEPPAQAQVSASAVRDSRFARLTKGVNLAMWFRTASPQTEQHWSNYINAGQLSDIRRQGFNHVRLSITPSMIFQPANPATLNPRILPYVDKAIALILANDLAVIIDMHATPEDGIADKMENQNGYTAKYATFWRELARYLSKHDPERVFFETMNEPMFLSSQMWYAAQETIITNMRQGAPNHTLIASSNNLYTEDQVLEPENFVQMQALAEQNIIYNFHFYDAMEFTHQGAEWVKEFADLRNLPYPSTSPGCTTAANALTDATAKQSAQTYCQSGWSLAKFDGKMKKAADWAKANNARIIINEFGVYDVVAPKDSRVRWFNDVRTTFDKYGFGWTVWAYDDNFGPTYYDYDDEKWVFNSAVMQALGMGSSNTPTPTPTTPPATTARPTTAPATTARPTTAPATTARPTTTPATTVRPTTAPVTTVPATTAPASGTQAVTSFTLIDTDTDQPVAGYNPLQNGAILNLANLPRNLTIRANTNPAKVGSVRFSYAGTTNYKTENTAPYAIAGDQNGGRDYLPWTFKLGSHQLTATPFSRSGASGSIGTALAISFSVVGGTSTPTRTATASSVEGKTENDQTREGIYSADKAIDTNSGTRWASKFSDPQWLMVDLGAAQSVSRVKLNWETAYGKAYKIQVSGDGTNWQDVYSTTAGDGGTDELSFPTTTARYVRMYGTQRGTIWGYSLWEFEIFS